MSWSDRKAESELVDRDALLPSVVLLHGRQERLCEEEPGEPKHLRHPVLEPFLWAQWALSVALGCLFATCVHKTLDQSGILVYLCNIL